MNYNDFRKTYAWTLKNYHGTHELYNTDFYGAIIGKCTTTRFEKRGNAWREIAKETESVSPAFYFNTVDAIPFFRNCGGRERVSCGYCVRGYVPLAIDSISPDGTAKTRRVFKLF